MWGSPAHADTLLLLLLGACLPEPSNHFAVDGDELLTFVVDFARLSASASSADLIIICLHCHCLLDDWMDEGISLLSREISLLGSDGGCERCVACPWINLHQQRGLLGIFHALLQLRHDDAFVCILAQSKLLAHLQAIAHLEIGGALLCQCVEVFLPLHVVLCLAKLLHEASRIVHVVNGVIDIHDCLPSSLQAQTHWPEWLEQRIASECDEWNKLFALPFSILFNAVIGRWHAEVQ